jgi:transposase
MRARHRLGKFLLRRGFHWSNGCRWTLRHHAWLRSLRFEHPVDELVFADYLRTVEEAGERVHRLDQALEEASQEEPYREPVGWLRCYRGIDTVTAMTLVAELFGIERFRSARKLMSYLGLTPSERTTSKKPRRGGITKTGNAHVRRVLVEAAWCQRVRPTVSRILKKRREGQPDWVIAHADRAMKRLHRKYHKLRYGGKHHNEVVAAVAREMAGVVWAVLCKVPLTSQP